MKSYNDGYDEQDLREARIARKIVEEMKKKQNNDDYVSMTSRYCNGNNGNN